jgi:hypothetical protein
MQVKETERGDADKKDDSTCTNPEWVEGKEKRKRSDERVSIAGFSRVP